MKPRRSLLLLITGLSSVSLGAACTREPSPPWWEAAIDGKASTIVGTMHAEADVDVLAPELFDRLERARVLLTEADVRTIDRAAFDAAIALEDGASLQNLVTDAEWSSIVAVLDGAVSETVATRVQPWFTEGQIIVSRLAPVEPVDAGLVARAEKAGVGLDFFESWQDQVTLLNGLGLDDGLSILLTTAADPDAAVAQHEAWARAYSAGDLDQMTALAFDDDARDARPAFYDEVVDRHRGWMDQVEDELRKGDAFIAVGFMHLLTDRGIPALLEERGFAVTPR